MKVLMAKSAGFCFGVRRALDICKQYAGTGAHCVTLGPIIHNDDVISMLEGEGVHAVSNRSEISAGDNVIIRSHGVGRLEMERLSGIGVNIIDATCPVVKKIHTIVEAESAEGRLIIIIGEREHPEIKAIAGWAQEYMIFETFEELQEWLDQSERNRERPIAVVFQTTGMRARFQICSEIIKKECTNYKIFDTICNATSLRQKDAEELSKIAQAMIVIGGKNSANSQRLAEICRESCSAVFFIENASQLDVAALAQFDTVGITAGASTPVWIIKEVNQKMSEEMMNDVIPEVTEDQPAAEEETKAEDVQVEDVQAEDVPETFEEMLEKSIKTLYTGAKVTGTITSITPTEISVDLGAKQSGYIPISELTDDPAVKPEDLIQVGDEIETFVLRVNDVEGTIMLSKKRLDSIKSWEDIEAARESKAVVEGTVVEENKGGIVVSVNGVRVFVPASQTGLPKDAPMSSLLEKKVRLRITEVNQSRRRVVGSIRSVATEERREKAEQIWNEIEEGKRYAGTVKSMTSYGAFVDIGGIDGMVHVSEISWSHIRVPSDVLSVGDEVEVYVISFDREKKKISLGYKNKEDDPWTKFTSMNAVGDTVNVKVVKLMPFGAFAEIIPGVDGLIHISQISDHRIGLPSEVLHEGQQVDVKITDIDNDKKKVSLSIRALISPESLPVKEQDKLEPIIPEDKSPVIVYDTDSPLIAEESAEEEAPDFPDDAGQTGDTE